MQQHPTEDQKLKTYLLKVLAGPHRMIQCHPKVSSLNMKSLNSSAGRTGKKTILPQPKHQNAQAMKIVHAYGAKKTIQLSPISAKTHADGVHQKITKTA